MKNSKIHNLFPIPIYMSNMEEDFSKKELDFVEDQKNYCMENSGGNINTIDKYILNRKELKKIKKFLENRCQDYLNKIICPKNNVKLYITQSWLNYTEEKQRHHIHSHPNSVISGVLYIDSDKDNDKIKFTQQKYQQIHPHTDENKFNLWNATSWWFPVETGQLIMFPSSTSHQVDAKKGSNTRISLAFNTFYKGIVGQDTISTELIL